ncbi:sensor histidine kinase [Fervidobacterium sp.]
MTTRKERNFNYILLNLASFVLILFFFIWFSVDYYRNWGVELETYLKSFSESLSYPAWTYDNRVIEQLVKVMVKKKDITFVSVYDDKGNKIITSTKEFSPNLFDQIFGTKHFTKTYNLNYADTFVGKVTFGYVDREPREFLQVIGLVLASLYMVIFLLISNLKKNQRLAAMVKELNDMNSELELAFNELEEAQNKVINSEKMAALGKLMVNIAHDVNTPAGIIYSSLTEQQNRLNSVREKFQSDELSEKDFLDCLNTITQLTEIMLRNSRRITELVQSLKRVAMNEMTQTYSEVSIKSLVDDVLNALHPKLRKTKVEIVTEISDDLVVRTMPGAIAQILMNLIDNAIVHAFEYDNPGKINIKFEKIKNKNEKEYLVLVFSDNGKGMEPEVQKRAFEPFYTTEPNTGTGLGLSIVYNLVVEILGGEIELESAVGKGTTFKIRIPVDK